jgi:hypothetical protein
MIGVALVAAARTFVLYATHATRVAIAMLGRMRVALLCLLAACASPKPLVSESCPPPASTEPAIPAEDAELVQWKQIAKEKDKGPPEGMSAASMVPKLVAYLSSIDPVRRDQIGYEVLATWLRGDRLTDDDCRALMKTLIAKLGTSTALEPAFGRSFSALVLSEVVRRDRKRAFLTDDERREVLRAARQYASYETDLRGYTGLTGWSHAAAHTGDLLAQLAQEPSFTDDDRRQVLDAVTSLVARYHGQRFAHGEDSRLAAPVIAVAKLGTTEAHVKAFIADLRKPLDEKTGPEFSAGVYYAQRNARDLLFTLYVYGSTAKDPTPGETLLFAQVKALIEE